MTETFTPPSPEPQKKDTVTFNKKNLAIAFFALAFFILLIVMIIPGDKSSSPSTTTAPIPTNPPVTAAPVVNKYDSYLNHVYNNSGKAYTFGEAKLIEFGDLVCGALDDGNSIRAVVNLLSNYSTGYQDNELFASVVFGSITYICPEYTADLNRYINN